MVRALFLIAVGSALTLLLELGVWLGAPGCRTNHLTIMGGLPKDQTATVSIGSQTIWTGTSWDGTRMDFSMNHVGESNFTIATGEGRVFQRGYIEPFDGQEHILDIDLTEVGYASFHRGLVAEAWDRLSCAARGRLY